MGCIYNSKRYTLGSWGLGGSLWHMLDLLCMSSIPDIHCVQAESCSVMDPIKTSKLSMGITQNFQLEQKILWTEARELALLYVIHGISSRVNIMGWIPLICSANRDVFLSQMEPLPLILATKRGSFHWRKIPPIAEQFCGISPFFVTQELCKEYTPSPFIQTICVRFSWKCRRDENWWWGDLGEPGSETPFSWSGTIFWVTWDQPS